MDGPQVKGLFLLDVILVLNSEDLCLLEDFNKVRLGFGGKYFFKTIDFVQLLRVYFLFF